MKLNRLIRAALAVVAAAGLAIGVIAPAHSAAKTTVSIVQSNALTGLNPNVSAFNLSFNVDVATLSGMGFVYYNNKPELTDNTAYGSYKIVSKKPFKVSYTVRSGQVWSDGTPMNAVDLLLSHITANDSYSEIAGLGDPQNARTTPAFDSGGYGGIYAENVVGQPILSANKMTVTIEYSSQVPDWKLLAPGPSPVHALMLLAEGEYELQSVAKSNAARERFLKAFSTYNTATLKKIGKVWSTSYNIDKVDGSTNPLLLVGNGPFMVKSAVPNGSVTMVRNPKYTSGPKVKAIKTVVFRVIGDGTAAAQALKNGEIDIYAGQPTGDAVNQLKAMAPAVKIIGGDQALYEHVDIRVGTAFGTTDTYNGVFAGNSQKALDLRTAVLLAWPREEIMEKIVKPINPSAQMMNSLMYFNSEPGYKDIIKKSGVSKFTEGTQASRNAKALALVKKYYPEATATNPVVKITLLFGAPSNVRRVAEAALAKASVAQAGFDMDVTPTAGWSSFLESAKYDLSFFGWIKSALLQRGNVGTYQEQNYQGYSNPEIEKIYTELNGKLLTPAEIADRYLKVETILMRDAISLPIFQHPAVTGVTAKLMGVAPSPLSPNLIWNVWDWYFTA